MDRHGVVMHTMPLLETFQLEPLPALPTAPVHASAATSLATEGNFRSSKAAKLPATNPAPVLKLAAKS